MNLKMTEILNLYDASEWLLDQDTPCVLAFKLADLIQMIKGKRDAFILAVSKMPRDENDEVNPDEFAALCNQEIDLDLPKIDRSALDGAYEKIPVKVALALQPLIKEGE